MKGLKPYTPKKENEITMQFMYTHIHANDKHNCTTTFLAQWGYASVSFQKRVLLFVCLFVCLFSSTKETSCTFSYVTVNSHVKNSQKRREGVGQCGMIWLFTCPRLLGWACVSCMPVFAMFSDTREEETIFIFTLLMNRCRFALAQFCCVFW